MRLKSQALVPQALNADQWKTLIASNLGWMFDGYRGLRADPHGRLALRQLLAAVAVFRRYRPLPGLVMRHNAARMGDRRNHRRRARRYISAGERMMIVADAGLFGHDRAVAPVAGTGFRSRMLRFLVGICDRLGMGDRRVDDGRGCSPTMHAARGAGLMQCGLGIGFSWRRSCGCS